MSALEKARVYAAGAVTRIQQRECRCQRCVQAIEEERLQAVLRVVQSYRPTAPVNIFTLQNQPLKRRLIIVKRAVPQ